MGLNHEKNGGNKSRDTLPLSAVLLSLGCVLINNLPAAEAVSVALVDASIVNILQPPVLVASLQIHLALGCRGLQTNSSVDNFS